MTGGVYSFFWFEKEHFMMLQKLLKVANLSDKIKDDLQNAHREFAIHKTFSVSRPSKTKKLLKKIEKHSAILTETLGAVDSLTEDVIQIALLLPEPISLSIEDLEKDINKLNTRIKEILLRLPPDKRGPNEKEWPLRTLVERLKTIYEDTTKKKATLTKAKESDPNRANGESQKAHNTPEGPFFVFVKEYLKIINYQPHSNFSLMGIIEEVLYPPDKKTSN